MKRQAAEWGTQGAADIVQILTRPSSTAFEKPEPGRARLYDILALIVCLGVGLLSFSLGASREVGNWGVETDFLGRDVGLAQNVLSGKPYMNQHYPPGYAYILAGMWILTHDFFKAGIAISVAASSLLALAGYGIVSMLYDRRLAFVTTLFVLLALLPHSFVASTDVLANFLLLAPLWLLLRREPTMGVCLLSGAAAGLACLVRYNAIFLLVGIPLALLFRSGPDDTLRPRLRRMTAFAAAALVVTAPWLIVNWQYHGSPFASDLHGQVAAHFYHPKGDGSPSSISSMEQQYASYWDVLTHDPVRVCVRFMKDIVHDRVLKLSWDVIGFPAFLFAGAGMLLYLRDLTRSRLVFLMVCGGGYLLHGLAGFADRFYLFLYPLLFLFVSLAALELGKVALRLQETSRVWNVSWILIVGLLFASGYTSASRIAYFLRTAPVYLLDAAEVLSARAVPGDSIMSLKPHLAYLAKLNMEPIEGLETIKDYATRARERHIRFIVYSAMEESHIAGLQALRDPSLMPPEFRVVYEHVPTRTLIYEFARPADHQMPRTKASE